MNHTELQLLLPILFATIAGSFIGIEREMRHRAAGIGTNMLICAGACIFAIISVRLDPGSPSRMAANVLTGVGFIGAGLIIKENKSETIKGLTTAAGIWMAAAIGIAFGTGYYILASFGTLIAIMAPRLPQWVYYKQAKTILEHALEEEDIHHHKFNGRRRTRHGKHRLPKLKK